MLAASSNAKSHVLGGAFDHSMSHSPSHLIGFTPSLSALFCHGELASVVDRLILYFLSKSPKSTDISSGARYECILEGIPANSNKGISVVWASDLDFSG